MGSAIIVGILFVETVVEVDSYEQVLVIEVIIEESYFYILGVLLQAPTATTIELLQTILMPYVGVIRGSYLPGAGRELCVDCIEREKEKGEE